MQFALLPPLGTPQGSNPSITQTLTQVRARLVILTGNLLGYKARELTVPLFICL
jgi:hypothetical protein